MQFQDSQLRTDGVFAIEKLPTHNKQNKLSLENHFLSYIDTKFTRVEVFIAVHLMRGPVCRNATQRRCACVSRRFEENHSHHLHGSRFFLDLSILRMQALHSFETPGDISCRTFHAMTQCHFWRERTSHTERVLLWLLSPAAATHVNCYNIKIVCILPTACSHFTWPSYSTTNAPYTRDSSVLSFR